MSTNGNRSFLDGVRGALGDGVAVAADLWSPVVCGAALEGQS